MVLKIRKVILTSARGISGKVDLESSTFNTPVDSLIRTGCLLGFRLSEKFIRIWTVILSVTMKHYRG